MPPFRRWAGGRSIRSIAGGGSYQDLKLPPTLSCLGWGSARKNRENILKGVVTVVLCACACPTLSPWTLAPTLDRVPLSQSQEDYTRKSKQPQLFLYRSLAPSLFGPHTLTTCACFIPRVLRQRGFVGWEKISEETSIEGKKSHEQLLSLSVSFPRVNTTPFEEWTSFFLLRQRNFLYRKKSDFGLFV